MIQFALYTAPGGSLLADYSHRIQGATFATNAGGWAEASGFIPMGLQESFQLYDRPGLPHVLFSDPSSSALYEGRLEDVNIVSGGVNVRAFGYARSLSDASYTALWSKTGVSGWQTLTAADIATLTPESYNIDYNNRIAIGLKKNALYANGLDYGVVGYRPPNGGSRGIVGIHLDMEISLPAGWNLYVQTRDDTWGSGVNIATIVGGTGVTALNKLYTFASVGAVTLALQNASGANYTNVLQDFTWYLHVFNTRIVTRSTNMVSTTTTAIVASGTAVSVPVVSTAHMYAGQHLNIGTTNGAEIIVIAVVDATHFTADIPPGSFASGVTVKAFVIYADEIASDLLGTVNTLNTAQLSSLATLIQSPAADLFDENYEDMYPADILDHLVKLGDNQTPPRQWEWGVGRDRLLYLRPQNSAARTWYIDVSELDIQRSLDALWNSVYATYQEAGGRTLRSAASADSASVARYGLTRRRPLSVQTTSLTQALIQRDASLNDSKDPKPRSGLTITQVFDSAGSRWPLTHVKAGDTMIIRNLAPTLSVAIDRIRVFRLTRTEYHFDDDTLTMEPEMPLPSLDALLSLALPPSWGDVPWWIQQQRRPYVPWGSR